MQETLLERLEVSLCRSISVRELNRIDSLRITEAENRLQPDDFANMPNLKELDLRDPDIDRERVPRFVLPHEIFRHLAGLTELSIYGYDATSVLSLDFANELPELQALQLWLTDCTAEPTAIFDTLTFAGTVEVRLACKTYQMDG